MTLDNVIKGLQGGSIVVNYMGHSILSPATNSVFGRSENYNLLKILKKHDAPSDLYSTGVRVCRSKLWDYDYVMNYDINVGDCIFFDPYYTDDAFCRCITCGISMSPYLFSENEIRFAPKRSFTNQAFTGVVSHIKSDANTEQTCEMEKPTMQGYLEAFINVREGLAFANYFCWQELDPNLLNYNINNLKGRNDLMQHLAKNNNVGYGQCDDTSGYIYMSEDRNKVLVLKEDPECDQYTYDGETYTYQGSVGFDVWSYKCADLADIKAAKKNHKKNDPLIHNYKEVIEVDVNPGKYRIRHYDSLIGDDPKDENVWSVIEKC